MQVVSLLEHKRSKLLEKLRVDLTLLSNDEVMLSTSNEKIDRALYLKIERDGEEITFPLTEETIIKIKEMMNLGEYLKRRKKFLNDRAFRFTQLTNYASDLTYKIPSLEVSEKYDELTSNYVATYFYYEELIDQLNLQYKNDIGVVNTNTTPKSKLKSLTGAINNPVYKGGSKNHIRIGKLNLFLIPIISILGYEIIQRWVGYV